MVMKPRPKSLRSSEKLGDLDSQKLKHESEALLHPPAAAPDASVGNVPFLDLRLTGAMDGLLPPAARGAASSEAIAPETSPLPLEALDSQEEVAEDRPARSPSLKWILLALALCGAVSSLAVGAFIWLLTIPPTPECDQISTFSPDRERLYCAQQSAASGELPDLLAGIDLLGDWSAEHPLHNEAQDWLEQWSDAVLAIAQAKLYDSDLEGAIELAQQVPSTSPLYDQAQASIQDWQAVWDAGKGIYNQAQTAIRNKDWAGASQAISQLGTINSNYWRAHQTAALAQQVQVEKQAHEAWGRARNQAQANTPEGLSAAVTTVSQIDPSTYTWWEAQAEMNTWSEALLVMGLQKWEAGQVDEAIALGERVGLNPNLKGTAGDLVKLAQARKRAFGSGAHWTVSPKHLWSLMEAIALAEQIQPESKYYAQAQTSIDSWQQQLQDLTTLQAAQVAADLGQRPMLEYAIAQAHQVEAGRPRRVQAQTLVAHWNQEIERIEDQPHLVHARKLAEPKTVIALKRAIAEASKVHLGRALRPEAQALIFVWNQDIQVIEDQPILNQARTLAQQGNLYGAIAQAGQIQSGRALYWEAQGAIANWQAEIRAAEAARRQRELDALKAAEAEAEAEETETPEEETSLNPLENLEREVEQRPIPMESAPPPPLRDFYRPMPAPQPPASQSPGQRLPAPMPEVQEMPAVEQAAPPENPTSGGLTDPTPTTTPAPFPTPTVPNRSSGAAGQSGGQSGTRFSEPDWQGRIPSDSL
jgi:hypothetical protein